MANSEKYTYYIENQSYEDRYGRWQICFVPFRIDQENKTRRKRLFPPHITCTMMEAEDIIELTKLSDRTQIKVKEDDIENQTWYSRYLFIR